MSAPTIRAVRVYLPPAPAADAPPARGWIFDSRVASPLSAWPEYRADRRSWGIGALRGGAVEVEISTGTTGVAPLAGGEAAAFLVERHLAGLVAGLPLTRESIEDVWERLFRATLPYGRRGLAIFALSAIDLALWDALGKEQESPVWALLGRKRHERLPVYATTPRPDAARALGFRGGKLPLPAAPAEGEEGLAENLALAARMREACGDPDDFFLAVDCYMSLDVPYAARLGAGLADLGFRWLEEPLPPDDYAGHAELRRLLAGRIPLAAGEHEATRWGFGLLLEQGCADLLQPDVGWCGGLTELLRIAALADARGIAVVPHGSSVYSYHFCAVRESGLAEFLLFDPDSAEPVPQLAPLFLGEPLPRDGRVRVPDEPGFGVSLDHRRAERYR